MSINSKPKIIAIVGPTASGKTDLSIKIAERFNGEIVSADARQIYRGMDIGTGKALISSEQSEAMKSSVPAKAGIHVYISGGIPHHLIDIKNPDEEYTVADYKGDAIKTINIILKKEKLPILTGGTGLYIKAVLENLNIPSVQSDPELRAKLEADIHEKGLDALFKRLVDLDPDAATVVDPQNPRRVVRALEVALTTGTPFTAQRKKDDPLYDALILGLNPPSEILRERIDARVDQMVRNGLVEEVALLLKKYGDEQIAFDTIGYQEIIRHFKGEISLEVAIAEIKMNTWHYAKRQMTWFKKNSSVRWLTDPNEAVLLVEKFLRG